MRKPKVGPNFRYFAKRHGLFDKYLLRGMRTLNKAEQVLLEDYARYKAKKDLHHLELSLSFLATFQLMLGRNLKAEEYLRERELMFPDSLGAKVQTAHFLGNTLRNYRAALRKLREIRLPKDPGEYDFDQYYNALCFRGVALLHTEQWEKAKETMAQIAEFTRQHLPQILLFFDLHFVELMIERRLALPHCRAYLMVLRQRKQVIHDHQKTLQLLRRVNKLLG